MGLLDTVFGGNADTNNVQRRNSGSCAPSQFTTPNGLVFQTYCGQGFGGDPKTIGYTSNEMDIIPNNLIDCMLECSNNFGDPCYGVSFSASSKTCTLYGPDIDGSPRSDSSHEDVAIAHSSQLQPLDTKCPYSPNIDVPVDGATFVIYCGADLPYGSGGYPYSSDGYGDFPFHTDTLEECMKICVHAHPLCIAVSWNPDMKKGYSNCYLHNLITAHGDKPVSDTKDTWVTHSATIVTNFLHNMDKGCDGGQQDEGGKTFDVLCRQNRTEFEYTKAFHTEEAKTCMQACASEPNDECGGMFFDMSANEGFENCYLLNDTGKTAGPGNATFARLIDSQSSNHSQTSTSSNSVKSSSRAWIAVPVVGGVVALILLGFIIWWWRRRHRTQWPKQALSTREESDADVQYLRMHGKGAELSEVTKYELSGRSRRPELFGNSRAELSDGRSRHSLRHELG